MDSVQQNTDMPRAALEIAIREDLRSSNVPHVRSRVMEQLEHAASGQPALVEMDLRGARMIDSMGLNLIVSVIRRVLQWGGATRVLVDDPNVYRTLQFTRLTSRAEVVWTSKEEM